ncbi:Helicase conserved C-terminal domain-containing protein [Nakamurella panacisegetis]|uniref:Helicase conserved C-terminal domain-containing protein n=1 Tax=Nakamurella panacisegetis TaxID=1090615 RepID=A0A1H0J7I7_9ACTN|nr:helicase C-terminal domain-containing protein [Nakamurella panacisegetis]SDO39686.1 Helicase conserved C-terminal domain-containing protein [Nakamurella panacisegetis]
MASTLEWLRGRDDAALMEMLRARPDLTVPAPTDLSVLARRLDSPPSVWRALESLNRFAVQVLESVVLLGAGQHAVTPAEVTAFLGKDAPIRQVKRVFGELETLALVRGGAAVRPSAAVPAAMGEFPGGFGPPGRLTADETALALASASDDGRALLARLAKGRPRGTVGTTGPLADLVRGLVDAGLLIRVDQATVLLPREVGLALRGTAPLGPVHTSSPPVTFVEKGTATVDGTAAGQAVAAVAVANRMLDLLGQVPAPALKSGGMGVRELRRLAKELDLDPAITALHVELLAAAGLIATSEPRTKTALNSWTPTGAADDFADGDVEESWSLLATTWLDLRRDPSRTGTKDAAGKVLAALSAELSWVRGPVDRRFVLAALAELPPGTGLEPESLSTRLAWSAPLRTPERRDPMAATVIAEATALGIVAFSAISTAGRRLLTGTAQEAAAELTSALPSPVDKVMVQADLTVVAPGRLVPELAARLAAAAEVESAGSATVYRVTPDSLRRAFDGGASTGDLHELFEQHSLTGVPQALTYLIDDVARRHGVLRVGAAASYLRSEDPALIDQAIAQAASSGVLVRRLAPTVAISTSRLEDLLAPLRQAGLVPAAEDASGTVIDLRAAPQRTGGATLAPARRREPPLPSEDQLTALIGRMRSADSNPETAEQSPQETLALLRHAADHRGAVWIGYVDSEGGTTRRMIEPVAVSGGAVAAFDRLRDTMRTFALHRITGVQAVPDAAP